MATKLRNQVLTSTSTHIIQDHGLWRLEQVAVPLCFHMSSRSPVGPPPLGTQPYRAAPLR